MEIGKNAADSVVVYCEVAKNVVEKTFNSDAEGFGETVDFIIFLLITLTLTGWLIVSLLSRGDEYQPIVDDHGEEELEDELEDE